MPCKVQVDHELEEEILDLDGYTRQQIGDFLVALQNDPLLQERHALADQLDPPAYFVQLQCGFYVSWEIIGDLLSMALTGKTKAVLVRILGVNRQRPN
jgi:hypothetical protein